MSKLVLDFFPFGGAGHELDILEIRLNELDSVVDYFLLAESNKSQVGIDKPFYFKENKERFSKFLPKIIDVQLDDFSVVSGGNWVNEQFQRNSLVTHCLDKLQKDKNITLDLDNTFVCISDLDEIPMASKLKEVIDSNPEEIVSFNHYFNSYFLNLVAKRGWYGTCVFKLKHLMSLSPQGIRNQKDNFKHVGVWDSEYFGWHLSNQCGKDFDILFNNYINKVEPYNKTFLHQTGAKESLEKAYKNIVLKEKYFMYCDDLARLDIKLDILPQDKLPTFVLENLDKFKHLLYE